MQSSSGGWAAFDKDNTLVILNRIPFADQEAMVDYPTVDVTGRVLEAMVYLGYDRRHPRAQKGIRFVKELQETDGAWWGRWGVNYVYGTWSVLKGLIAIGEDPKSAYIRAAVRWLKDQSLSIRNKQLRDAAPVRTGGLRRCSMSGGLPGCPWREESDGSAGEPDLALSQEVVKMEYAGQIAVLVHDGQNRNQVFFHQFECLRYGAAGSDMTGVGRHHFADE